VGGVDRELQLVVGDAEQALGPADVGPSLAVEDICLGEVGAAGLDEGALDEILDLLDGRPLAELLDDPRGTARGESRVAIADGALRLGDGPLDPRRVEGLDTSVPLHHLGRLRRHRCPPVQAGIVGNPCGRHKCQPPVEHDSRKR